MAILKSNFRLGLFANRRQTATANAQSSSDVPLVKEPLDRLFEQICALTPGELETLEFKFHPEQIAEILKQSDKARSQPESLVTFEAVFGSPVEGGRIKLTTAAKETIHKFSPAAQRMIGEEVVRIATHPDTVGNPLKESLQNLWASRATYRAHSYRIVYEMIGDVPVVEAVIVVRREDFYQYLEGKLGERS